MESEYLAQPQAIALLLYLPFVDDVRSLYVRNELGVPVSIASGALFVRRVSTSGGQDLWSATWRGHSVIHVLIAPSERILDALIDSMGLSKPEKGTGSRFADVLPDRSFEAVQCRGRVL